jgi:RimJ/RimL family protein N-acetyltransferase
MTLMGFAGLERTDLLGRPVIEVGARLDPAYWGRGFGSEACRAALADGFARLDVDEIVSIFQPTNDRALRLVSALGMSSWPAVSLHRYSKPVCVFWISREQWARGVTSIGRLRR